MLTACSMFASAAHCSKSYGEEQPGVPSDAGGSGPTDATDATDGAPSTIDGPDAGSAAFCTGQADAALCEDFEGAFPPPGWTLGTTTSGVTLGKGVGVDSTGGLEVRFLGLLPDGGFSNGSLVRSLAGTPTSIRVVARIQVERIDPPAGESSILILGLSDGQFVTLTVDVASNGFGVLVVGKGDGGTAASETHALGPISTAWTEVDLRLTKSGITTTLTALVNGSLVNSGPVPLQLGAQPALSLGIRTSSGSGARTIRFDNVLVVMD